MKKIILFLAIGLLCSMMYFSCTPKQSSFPTFPGYTRTDNGLYFKEIVKGSGKPIQKGDIITARLAYYINDSLLFTTDSTPNPFQYKARDSFFPGDILEAFAMMHVGDSMSFMIKADSSFIYLFKDTVPPAFITPESYLRWEVAVDDAVPEEVFQQSMLDAKKAAQDEFKTYLENNGIKELARESGLVYVRTKQGKGTTPGYKQKVKVHYTGKLLDGTVFESSLGGDPIEFQLGIHRVIKGWDEGIALMQKGEKGILYIPYYLAYGAKQMGPIPPFSNLIFEVELVDFE